MRYEVLLTARTERDLEEIHDCIAEFDSPGSAERVPDRLLAAVESLATFPERGPHPRELLALGIRDFRQTQFKPYRVICRVIGRQVVIHAIADAGGTSSRCLRSGCSVRRRLVGNLDFQ